MYAKYLCAASNSDNAALPFSEYELVYTIFRYNLICYNNVLKMLHASYRGYMRHLYVPLGKSKRYNETKKS